MTMTPDDKLQPLQLEVQRLLGRCLLNLQLCERQAKAIAAHSELRASVHDLEAARAGRIAKTAGKTLGTVVGDLLGSYIVTNDKREALETQSDGTEATITTLTFGYRIFLEVSDTEFTRIENELKEFVTLRNGLVHHFIEQHDLQSLDGCRRAQDALVAAHSRIVQNYELLRGLAEDMVQARNLLGEYLHSGRFREFFVNGIAPDGTVSWPRAGIVDALRAASAELAVDGWTSIADASKWIEAHRPEQLPAKYGCRSWGQVVHEARIFELRRRETDGNRVAMYREKSTPRSHPEARMQ